MSIIHVLSYISVSCMQHCISLKKGGEGVPPDVSVVKKEGGQEIPLKGSKTGDGTSTSSIELRETST